MKVLNAVIVDDEINGRDNLKNLLKTYCQEIEVIGMAASAAEAKKLIYELNPDVLFLDINMPKVNGFDLLESLVEKNFLLVMVTAHSEFGIQAVKANAVDYLLKPVSIKELQQAVKKLISISQNPANQNPSKNNQDKIVVSHFQGFSILNVGDIQRLEGESNYTKIYMNEDKTLTVSKTLKDFETILPADSFFRIHKSDIINLKYLKEYSNFDGGTVTLKCGTKITISRRRLPEFLEKVRNYSLSVMTNK